MELNQGATKTRGLIESVCLSWNPFRCTGSSDDLIREYVVPINWSRMTLEDLKQLETTKKDNDMFAGVAATFETDAQSSTSNRATPTHGRRRSHIFRRHRNETIRTIQKQQDCYDETQFTQLYEALQSQKLQEDQI